MPPQPRPSSSRDFTPPFFVGLDLGGTNVKAGVVDDGGRVLSAVDRPTEADKGADAGLKNICAAAHAAVEAAALAWTDIAAVGLGSPGTMDIPAGLLLDPVNLRGPGWQNFPIRDRVAAELQKPTAFQNDANAAAYGEFWAGAGQEQRVFEPGQPARRARSMVLFTLGTGIGCGIILGDTIVEGQHSHGAECGHIILDMNPGARVCGCGQSGHLEAYASATAVVKRMQEALDAGEPSSLGPEVDGRPELTAKVIGDAAAAGDRLALRIVMETARYLGVGAVTLMHTIDPDLVVYGGAMTFGRDETPLGRRFLDEIRDEIRRRAFPVPAERTHVVYATLGNNAGFIGDAGCARLEYRRRQGGAR